MDLLTHLFETYQEQLVAAGHDEKSWNELSDQARNFVDFANDYLRKHPPVQINYPEGGVGVVLSNHVQVLVAPADNIASSTGSMQPSHSIPVTGLETARDMRNTGTKSFDVLEGQKDMSQGSAPVNYKLPQPRNA